MDNARDWYDCGSDCGLGGTYQVTFDSAILSFIFSQVPEGCCKWKKETPGGSWQATNTTSEEVSMQQGGIKWGIRGSGILDSEGSHR